MDNTSNPTNFLGCMPFDLITNVKFIEEMLKMPLIHKLKMKLMDERGNMERIM